MAESGFPGFEAVDWKLIVAPKNTNAEIAKKLNTAVNKALQDPAVLKQLQDEGSTPLGGSMQDAANYLQKEQKQLGNADSRRQDSAGISAFHS